MSGPYAPGWYDAQLPDLIDAEHRQHARRIAQFFTRAREVTR